MLNFLILLYLRAFKISCSAEWSMKNVYMYWERHMCRFGYNAMQQIASSYRIKLIPLISENIYISSANIKSDYIPRHRHCH